MNIGKTTGNSAARFGLIATFGLGILLLILFISVEQQYTEGQLSVPLDDAWIHFQFARNLSKGEGFSFNQGELTPGSTAPLWTMLLAAFGLLSQRFLEGALIFSAVSFLLTIILTFGLSSDISGKPAIGLLAALSVTLTGRLLWAGLAGMETTAFTAFSLAAVWVYYRTGLRPASAILFGLATQFRPEGHALFLLAIMDTLWSTWSTQQESTSRSPLLKEVVNQLALPILIYVVLSLPYIIFSLSTTGRPFPNAFYAKVNTNQLFGWRTLGRTVLLHWRDNPLAILLVVPGLMLTWRRCRLIVAWLIALPILSGFLVDFVWHHGRYTMPLIPFTMIIAAQGFEWLLEKIPAKAKVVSAFLIVALVILAGAWQLPRWARQLGQNSREILDIDVAIGRWLAENTRPDEVIAVDDIGAIGYLSNRPIFDLNGLISPQMWPILHNEPRGILRNEATTRILSEVQPGYMAIFPLWHWELATNTLIAEPIESFHAETRTIIGDQEAAIYRSQWPYLQDYPSDQEPYARLGESFQLLNFDLRPPVPSQPRLNLTLYWHSLAETEESYDVFVHIVDAEGKILAQSDHKPVDNLAPTNRWQPGDVIKDIYRIDWPQDTPQGTYRVQVGMYIRDTGQRLPAAAQTVIDDAILLSSFDWSVGTNNSP